MADVTQMAVAESREAIWNYDPALDENRIGSGIDVIAAIRTLTVKVCLPLPRYYTNTNITLQLQASGQRKQAFQQQQINCGITKPLVIPLHGNTRWGSAAKMLERAYKLREVCPARFLRCITLF